MSDSFDKVFGPDSKPIRRSGLFRATQDSGGKWIIEGVEGEATTLSAEGSIDTGRVLARFHCGHFSHEGLGGQCSEPGCENVSCKQCFTRCGLCLKPTCLEHTNPLQIETGVIHLCCRCHQEVKRKRFWQSAVHLVLRPFLSKERREKI
jgi:hypothetical protein